MGQPTGFPGPDAPARFRSRELWLPASPARAIVAAAAAVGVPVAMTPILKSELLPSATYVVVVAIVAALGRLLPALAASIVAALLVAYHFEEPVGTFGLDEGWWSFASFVVVGAIVAVIVASRAALARELDRLFQERAHIARTLQSTLLPRHLPAIPGVELAARYEAVGDGVEVGGDFYDVLPSRHGTWTALVGDVSGKGPEAASLVGLLRASARSAVADNARPRTVLRALHDALADADAPEGTYATACCLRITPDRDGVRLQVGCGGHPTPFVVRRDGAVEAVDASGTLLGLLPDIEVDERDADLRPGDAIVAYTDGLTERARDEAWVEDVLIPSLTEVAGRSADDLADAIVSAAGDLPGPPRDDVAVLVVAVSRSPAPGDPGSPVRAPHG